MFVTDEFLVDLNFPVARARLANMAYGSSLTSASQRAYGDGLAGLKRVGPRGAAAGVSKLVEVHRRELVIRDGSAVLSLRWEATGPFGGLFAALDADIMLTSAGEHAARISLAGVYRPPPAGFGAELDRAILHQVATTTIRSLLSHVAETLAHPERACGPVGELAYRSPSGGGRRRNRFSLVPLCPVD